MELIIFLWSNSKTQRQLIVYENAYTPTGRSRVSELSLPVENPLWNAEASAPAQTKQSKNTMPVRYGDVEFQTRVHQIETVLQSRSYNGYAMAPFLLSY